MKKQHLKESRYVTALCVWVPNAHALIEGCRYDSCYPASEVESHKIERLAQAAGDPADPADHIIRLVWVARTDGPPTLDRWRSFSAYVLDVRHPQETPLTDAELGHLAELNLRASGVPRRVDPS